ncbi:hypothetical protein ACFL17_06195, partial [Pseudomonadota bacterium]
MRDQKSKDAPSYNNQKKTFIRPVAYFGKEVMLFVSPRWARFFSRLKAGLWEPNTFHHLETFIDKDTVYVDIGGWIGATPYWAAQIAKKVITVEPDPVCVQILQDLKDCNSGDVEILDAALSGSETIQ